MWTAGALSLRLSQEEPGAVAWSASTSCGQVDVAVPGPGWVRAGSGELGAAFTALRVEGFNGRTWTVDCPGGSTLSTVGRRGTLTEVSVSRGC